MWMLACVSGSCGAGYALFSYVQYTEEACRGVEDGERSEFLAGLLSVGPVSLRLTWQTTASYAISAQWLLVSTFL